VGSIKGIFFCKEKIKWRKRHLNATNFT
jgi:hypothetical protein